MAEKRYAPSTTNRNDLDFLKDDGDNERGLYLRYGIIGIGAIAFGALMFFLIRGSGNPIPDDQLTANQDGGPPRPSVSAPAPSAKLVSAPAFETHRPDWWIQQWNSGSDLISNARGKWTQQSPIGHGSADVKTNVDTSGPVNMKNVILTMVSLEDGQKRIVGRADIVNLTDHNVLDFRGELVWGANTYLMIALQGDRDGMHQVYERALKPGQKISVQFVSLKIKDHPDGTPNALRLTSWLDGKPDISIYEYPIALGH